MVTLLKPVVPPSRLICHCFRRNTFASKTKNQTHSGHMIAHASASVFTLICSSGEQIKFRDIHLRALVCEWRVRQWRTGLAISLIASLRNSHSKLQSKRPVFARARTRLANENCQSLQLPRTSMSGCYLLMANKKCTHTHKISATRTSNDVQKVRSWLYNPMLMQQSVHPHSSGFHTITHAWDYYIFKIQ